MKSTIEQIKKLLLFLKIDLWRVRTDKMSSRQGKLIRFIRVLSLSLKGFNEDKCISKASALTYFTLFSVVPLLALVFAIAKGFGFEEKLQQDLVKEFGEHKEVLDKIFVYSHSLLENAQGGILAGVGILILLWSVMNLLSNIENSFNEIWEIRKGRSLVRKFTDYLSIMLISPIFILLSGSITVVINSGLGTVANQVAWLPQIGVAFQIILKLFSLLLITFLFTFIYVVLPNTKVKLKSAAFAGLIAAILFELLEWVYIKFLVGAMSYNKVYGSFAVLPLFLIWVQYSWYVVLLGAEISFSTQNVDNYELENEIKNISPRLKKTLSLLLMNLIVSNFKKSIKPFSSSELAVKLDFPLKLVNIIVSDLMEVGLLHEVRLDDEKEIGYQPAVSDSVLTVGFVLDRLDTKGHNEIPIDTTPEFLKLATVLKEFDSISYSSQHNLFLGELFNDKNN